MYRDVFRSQAELMRKIGLSRKSIRTIEDKWYGQVFEDEDVERAVAWQYNPVEASSPLGYQPPFWKQWHPSFSNHILTLGVGMLA